MLPYKHLIGKVILDKNQRIRSVVNKVASIATEFRTFPLEVLAGTDDLVVDMKEVCEGREFCYFTDCFNPPQC